MFSPYPLLSSTLLLLAALTASTHAAGIISFSPAFTDDASTGISTDNIYTHAISGGAVGTVNGVNFAALTTASTPANFSWAAVPNSKNSMGPNNNAWVPATGGVTGADTINLLGSFTWSGSGTTPGDQQTFTLSGLTPGETYDTRIYVRAWDPTTTTRLIDLAFDNSGDIDTLLSQFGSVLSEDQPTVHGFANNNQAFYISYEFTALGTDLVVNAPVATGGTGSFHLYALTNQLVEQVPEPGSLAIWGLLGIAALAVGWRCQRKMTGR